MSLDRSLKAGGALDKHRNVLTRAERVAKLTSVSKFDMEKDSPLGMVKVANRKVTAGGKSSKKAAATEETTEGAPAADAEPPKS